MKSIFNFILLILLIGITLQEDIQGQVFHTNNKDKIITQKLSQKNLEELIKHNMGNLNHIPQSKESQELIESFGSDNILNPTKFNYLFLIENNDEQENESQLNLENINAEKLIKKFNRNKQTKQRLYSKVQKHQKEFAPHLVETPTHNLFDLLAQIKTLFQEKKISFDLSTHELIINDHHINVETIKNELIAFIQDIINIIELSKEDYKEEPELLTIYIHSLSELKNVVEDKETFQIFEQILLETIELFQKNLENTYSQEELAGFLLFLNENQNRRILSNNRRNLDLDLYYYDPFAGRPIDQQIYVWMSVILIVAVLFSVLALFTLKYEDDSLLFAKFLTIENK